MKHFKLNGSKHFLNLSAIAFFVNTILISY